MAEKKPGKNFTALKKAKVIREEFTAAEKKAIESLSDQEVKAIVSAKKKLGESFIEKHMPHGMMF